MLLRYWVSLGILCLSSAFTAVYAKEKKGEEKANPLKELSMPGLTFRSIGPAVTGGRIAAIAVDPHNPTTYFAGSGHGNLWKTVNGGTTFTPVFDNQGAYAIGAIAIDPSNSNVIWVGTGENNCQSNSGYGDGVYRSEDGGKTWKNMGLKESEHIGGIAIHPENSQVVFVAAYGSQRRAGGDRGIYKTMDGGKTWERVLFVNEFTGFFQIQMDPRDPDLLYAAAHQRMRKHFTNVYGGPESGIHRSQDGGVTWEKLTNGLPSGDMGRIGMAISPANPDIVYALVHAEQASKGFYVSRDRGSSWTKQSSYLSSYPFYFQKIVADPVDPDRVYSMDVFMQVTHDGGKTWERAGSRNKHVDDHCMWINPSNPNHLIAGCDGGVYESFDRAKNWSFKSNLPIAEIYKVTVDNAKPFYNVYIGTQDNNSLTGPSQTISSGGITNQDWVFTNSGDGFESQVDWKDPNVVYAQSQFGGLVRFDKKSGENLYIRPYEFTGSAYRFDWDAALLISKHDHKRLYFGGNIVLKTEDRGSTWHEISPDLTRGVPQEMESLMGQSWRIDQLVAKGSTANVVTLAESPLDEKILFAGSADGLIHVTTDGGANWTKSVTTGLPKLARVHHIVASHFDRLVAYAACHDMIGGDYKPYLLKTSDGGKSWQLINGDLPERGSTYTVAEDHENANLLFVGTQFGAFFTVDGGTSWIKFKNGLPAHCVMDLDIQREANDLVVSTFGRGVYILDNYAPLRDLSPALLEKDALLFDVEAAEMYIEANPFGYRGVGSQGANFYSASNPPVGAVFTYYIKEDFKSLKDQRLEKEKKLQKEGKKVPHPSYDVLRKESEEQEPFMVFTIKDAQGEVIRRFKKSIKKGLHRLVWDFRHEPPTPISLTEADTSVPWIEPDRGYMAVPGTYSVEIQRYEDGAYTEWAPSQTFECRPLNLNSIPTENPESLQAFNRKVAELARVCSGADDYRSGLLKRMSYLEKAVMATPRASAKIMDDLQQVEQGLAELDRHLNGDGLKRRYEGATPTSVKQRVDLITAALWSTTAAPTTTFIKSYEAAAAEIEGILTQLMAFGEKVNALEAQLEAAGAPSTPGRLPSWKK